MYAEGYPTFTQENSNGIETIFWLPVGDFISRLYTKGRRATDIVGDVSGDMVNAVLQLSCWVKAFENI